MPFSPSRLIRDPKDPKLFIDPQERLQQLQQGFQQNPGRAPGGSGTTGIRGFLTGAPDHSRMLEEQQEFLNLRALTQGRRAPNVQLGGSLGSTRTLAPATGMRLTQSIDPENPTTGSLQQALDAIRKAVGQR